MSGRLMVPSKLHRKSSKMCLDEFSEIAPDPAGIMLLAESSRIAASRQELSSVSGVFIQEASALSRTQARNFLSAMPSS